MGRVIAKRPVAKKAAKPAKKTVAKKAPAQKVAKKAAAKKTVKKSGKDYGSKHVLKDGKIKVTLSSFGAMILKLELPDRKGKVEDCVLGFDTVAEYDRDRDLAQYFGAVVGRIANRMGNSEFTLDGKKYKLAANEKTHHLHGGDVNWHRRNYKAKEIKNGVEFRHTSEDGDGGYPGKVHVLIRYTLKNGTLATRYEAKLDKAETKSTPISIACHAYFNMAGHNSENGILSHTLQVLADGYTAVDGDWIPTKVVEKMDDHPSMDFRKPKQVEAALRELAAASGYTKKETEQTIQRKGRGVVEPFGHDHNYCLNNFKRTPGAAGCPVREVLTLAHPDSGRVMKVSSSAPGVQVYFGNYIQHVPGKGGYAYKQRAGMCLETQSYPNAISPDAKKFPEYAKGACFILRPGGKPYVHDMNMKFGTK